MRERKAKSPKKNSVETPTETVNAEVVEASLLPVVSEVNAAASPEYTVAIEAVVIALAAYGSACWNLAWAIVDFKAVHKKHHPAEHLTDKQLVHVLGIKLSHQRIGQLVNTANAFPREDVDESIDFKVYELARKQHKRMTPQKRLALVKDNPTTAAIQKLRPKTQSRGSAVHQKLTLTVVPASVDNEPPEVDARLNLKSVTLPSHLIDVIRAYAVQVFEQGKAKSTTE